MLQAWAPLILLVIVLALLPWGLKYLQRRGTLAAPLPAQSRIISVLAVGTHQRVVTVEVGPADARCWLTLGVTAQSINCLHTHALAQPVQPGANAQSADES